MSPNPIYLKAGIIPYRRTAAGEFELLLITSRERPDSWIFPVGTVEPGETLAQTAAREGREESGYLVSVTDELGSIDLQKPAAIHRLTFFAAAVLGETDDWETDRQRRWVPLPAVVAAVPDPFQPIARAAQQWLSQQTYTLLRTPEEQFAHLPGYPFSPHYASIHNARLHYLDEGAGHPIVCLHGEPSWSYLYRKMIPVLAAHHRVLAPDFPGFGRSDKYLEREAYSFQMHRDALVAWLDALNLDQITLVMQDWGGLIGLRLVGEMPDRFARLVIMNTGLPTGDMPMTDAFEKWRDFAARLGNLPIKRVIRMGLSHPETLSPAELAAYEAPFPHAAYKAGAAVWPLLVPMRRDDPGAAEMRRARTLLSHWRKPALVIFSDGDPITRGGARLFRKLIPSAPEQPEITIADAGHFLQEEKGAEIAAHILSFISRTPLPAA